MHISTSKLQNPGNPPSFLFVLDGIYVFSYVSTDMDIVQNFLILMSRTCICSLYLWAGWAKISNWKGTIAYMQSKNLPLISLMLPTAIILQIVGGLSLLLGIYCRLGTVILIAFTIPAMIKMHNFWQVDDTIRTIEKTLFMKDVAIVGGLLAISILGPGTFSLDALLSH